jgi:myo-inositol 2-dehydrogenase / D-chiro-inositol 1-dehydrogenase
MAFKICMIGCGGMAVNGHGPMLKKYSAMRQGVELAACCDIFPERAESFAASFGFSRAYTDLVEMLDTVKPDGAVLAVPIELTARIAVEILKRHIPLLTEKPPGRTMEEGAAIVAAAESAGVPVSAAFNRRTMPLVEALAQEISAVGKAIDSMTIEMCRVCRTEADFSTTAIHDVDLARYLCHSDISSANFIYHVHEANAPAADISVLARMESGTAVNLGFYPMCGTVSERVTVRLHGHLFRVELPVYGTADVPGRIVHMEDNRIASVITGEEYDDPAQANGFLGEHTSFFDAIREGRTPNHSVEGSLQSLEVSCCISNRELNYIKSADS